jgi:nitrate/nitrite transporter NarK
MNSSDKVFAFAHITWVTFIIIIGLIASCATTDTPSIVSTQQVKSSETKQVTKNKRVSTNQFSRMVH